MNTINIETLDLGEIKINVNECDCCLTTDDLLKCPLENCEYIICKKCLQKIRGTLCPACRRKFKKENIRSRRKRIETIYFFCLPISRSTARKIKCLQYLIFSINLILASRLVWFLIFNDKPFFHKTWILSTFGGIITFIFIFLLLTTVCTIIGVFINCITDCCCCLLYDDNWTLIETNCVCNIIENHLCGYVFGCFDNCIRREIHYMTDENDTYIVSDSDYSSDYSSDDSLELD